ncbi:MAG: hypothetical protein RLZZ399_404 [Verrucomicrobiota bacterium]|jgi:uncharacterized protein (DUF1501 family)
MLPSSCPPHTPLSRRAFLHESAFGLGGIALASLLSPAHAASSNRAKGVISTPHTPVRAKRIIFLCMAGGPSHLETFDWKPELQRIHEQAFPESFTKGQQLAQLQGIPLKARGPFCTFQKYGQSGQEISTLFPGIASMADDIAIIRSMQTEQINHDTAHAFLNTGSIIKGRPSLGSWLLYGLGAETEELPGFVVLTSTGKTGVQPISARQWSSGVLPGQFQGIQFQGKGQPVHYLGNPEGIRAPMQREIIQEVQRLNELTARRMEDPEASVRIAQYEMAFRMQSSVPDLADLRSEPPEVLEAYGIKEAGDGSFASNCLLARRLAERGVRMVQLYHRGWDHHNGLEDGIRTAAEETDRATAALLRDLKQRGLLDDTLVVWGGEFGRTPMGQGTGRDHHILAFSLFLAGGGIRGGLTYGATDELGYRAVDKVVHVHDLQATLLHLMGIDHLRLSTKFQGLDVRLTGVSHAKVLTELFV